MNNVFAGLMATLERRPGDHAPRRPAQKRDEVEEVEMTAERLRKREAALRRPNAHQPYISNPWRLTAVQCQVARRLAAGQENRAIAQELNVSRKTIEVHVQHIKERMGDVTRVRAGVLWDRFERGDDIND